MPLFNSNTTVDNISVGGGLPLKRILTAVAVLDFPSILVASSQELTISVPGAVVGDSVSVGFSTAPDVNVSFYNFVSAPGVVTVRARNISTLSVDPVSSSYRITVFGF